METIYRNSDEMEMSISIKDLLMRICLKWRVMIVWAIIFAVLFNCVGILKSYRAIQAQKQAENEKNNVEVQIENAEREAQQLRQLLNDRECADVERAAENYENLNDQYQVAMEYYDNSIRMQLNANCVPTLTMQYHVDTHFEVEYPMVNKKDNTSSILAAFCDLVASDEVCNELIKAISIKTDVAYIKEIIIPYVEEDNLCITIVSPSRSDCEAMANVIRESMSESGKKLVSTFGVFDLVEITENYGEVANGSLLSEQTTIINNINNLRNSIYNLTYGMTDNQKNYYTALLKLDSIANSAGEMDDSQVNESDNVLENMTIQYINVKMLIVGVIFGVFIVCVCVAIKYIVSGQLRTAVDIEKVFGVRNFGSLSRNSVKNFVDRFIYKFFDGKEALASSEQMRIICAGIRITAQKKGVQKLYITGSSRKEEVESFCDELCENLKNDFSQVEYGMSIIIDPDSLQKMSESDGIVFIEKIDSSKYKDIKKEIDISLTNQIPIIGSIVVE